MQNPSLVSIVLPVHNEEESIGVLLREIESVFEKAIRAPYEIIIVDDASDDGSVAVINASGQETVLSGRERDSSLLIDIRILSQPVRSGQSKALMKGLHAARGELIVTMDADLQYDPVDIPRLLEKLDGLAMVCGVRRNRTEGIARRLCSRIANAFRNWITGDSISDSGCVFRVMRRQCVEALLPVEGRLFGCEFFFHPLFVRRSGFLAGEAEVTHRARRGGKSNYRLIRGRLLRGIAACIRARRISRKAVRGNVDQE